MNQNDPLRLQAYVDGELGQDEARRVEELLARDAEARTLVEALRQQRVLLREHSPVRVVPETREFYWSKIERAIRPMAEPRSEPARAFGGGWLSWRWWAPAFGLAALALLTILPVSQRPGGRLAGPGSNGALEADLETIADEMSSMTFRSEREGITVVWVQHRLN